MYCIKCGKEIKPWQTECENCGNRNDYLSKKTSKLAFIVSILVPLVGFILWLAIVSDDSDRARKYLLAGLVQFAICFLIASLVEFLIYFFGIGILIFGV